MPVYGDPLLILPLLLLSPLTTGSTSANRPQLLLPQMNTPIITRPPFATKEEMEFRRQNEVALLMRELFDLWNAQQEGYVLVDFEHNDDDEEYQAAKLKRIKEEEKKERLTINRLTEKFMKAMPTVEHAPVRKRDV